MIMTIIFVIMVIIAIGSIFIEYDKRELQWTWSGKLTVTPNKFWSRVRYGSLTLAIIIFIACWIAPMAAKFYIEQDIYELEENIAYAKATSNFNAVRHYELELIDRKSDLSKFKDNPLVIQFLI